MRIAPGVGVTSIGGARAGRAGYRQPMPPTQRDRRRLWYVMVVVGAALAGPACGGAAKPAAAPIVIKPMPTEESATVTTVRAVIESEPARASVFIDGVLAGQTPLEIELPAGARRVVKVALDGYVDKETTVTPEAGRLLVLQVTLSPR